MCKFCEIDNDGDLFARLASDGHKPSEVEGFYMIMASERGASIENSRIVQHETIDNKVFYIKACEWDKEEKRYHHIAVEIKYCPFCGDKL